MTLSLHGVGANLGQAGQRWRRAVVQPCYVGNKHIIRKKRFKHQLFLTGSSLITQN